jgi:hypothetical protein
MHSMDTATLEKLRRKVESDGYHLVPIDSAIEFGRFDDLKRYFGIPRSTAYLLLNEGLIRSRILKLAGSRHGIRLIDFSSVRSLLNGAPTKPSKEISRAMRAARKRAT